MKYKSYISEDLVRYRQDDIENQYLLLLQDAVTSIGGNLLEQPSSSTCGKREQENLTQDKNLQKRRIAFNNVVKQTATY